MQSLLKTYSHLDLILVVINRIYPLPFVRVPLLSNAAKGHPLVGLKGPLGYIRLSGDRLATHHKYSRGFELIVGDCDTQSTPYL